MDQHGLVLHTISRQDERRGLELEFFFTLFEEESSSRSPAMANAKFHFLESSRVRARNELQASLNRFHNSSNFKSRGMHWCSSATCRRSSRRQRSLTPMMMMMENIRRLRIKGRELGGLVSEPVCDSSSPGLHSTPDEMATAGISGLLSGIIPGVSSVVSDGRWGSFSPSCQYLQEYDPDASVAALAKPIPPHLLLQKKHRTSVAVSFMPRLPPEYPGLFLKQCVQAPVRRKPSTVVTSRCFTNTHSLMTAVMFTISLQGLSS